MSVKYIPVQWNSFKWKYNFVLLLAIFAYIFAFFHFGKFTNVNFQIIAARAFGSLAFFMLSFILAIGPLARLNTRFLPLLYNRRHFGVLTLFVAITHAGYIINWYYSFSPFNKFEALFFANTSFTQLLGFPFEIFGIFALFCLALMAFTSHDFWLKFLTPPLWKKIHMLVYFAYIAIVAHIALGAMQAKQNNLFTIIFIATALAVCLLHILAYLSERKIAFAKNKKNWVRVCHIKKIAEGEAKIIKLQNDARVAVFLHQGKLSAIANACAHQNGPLGEGRIRKCLITCPWHGFQYDIRNGRSPKPFTEKIPTYNIKIEKNVIWVDDIANAPGTYVKPLAVEVNP